MTAEWLPVLTLLAALGSGVTAGVFFAFSAFVMRGLARLPGGEGMAAMQAINLAAPRSAFLAVLLGTAAASLVLVVVPWTGPWDGGAALLPAAGMLYLAGPFGVTVARSVPLNDALAAVERGSAPGDEAWRRYVARWTAWNHVRTVAALASAAAYTLALHGG